MSDLSSSGCGCEASGMNKGCGCTGSNNSCLWIILLLFLCNNKSGCKSGCGNDFGFFGKSSDNGCCKELIWILLLSAFCGGNNGCLF